MCNLNHEQTNHPGKLKWPIQKEYENDIQATINTFKNQDIKPNGNNNNMIK